MKYLTHLYPKDETFFKVVAIAGNITKEDANRIDISASRLKNMEKEKLIEKVTYPSRHNGNPSSNISYALTKAGKEFVKETYGIARCQNSHAVEHNCKVSNIICGLDKKELESLQSEWQTRDLMQELIDNMRNEGDYDHYDYYMDLWNKGAISAVDIVYTSSSTNSIVAIEVVTNSYKDSDIEAKEVCSELLETQVEYVHV
jgi:hypothetical protein